MELTWALRLALFTQEALVQTLLLVWTGAILVFAGVYALLRLPPPIRPGMSEDEVRDAMGRPTRVARAAARAKWMYCSRSRTRKTVISFRGGRVSRVESKQKT